jgi:hypothetical protein
VRVGTGCPALPCPWVGVGGTGQGLPLGPACPGHSRGHRGAWGGRARPFRVGAPQGEHPCAPRVDRSVMRMPGSVRVSGSRTIREPPTRIGARYLHRDAVTPGPPKHNVGSQRAHSLPIFQSSMRGQHPCEYRAAVRLSVAERGAHLCLPSTGLDYLRAPMSPIPASMRASPADRACTTGYVSLSGAAHTLAVTAPNAARC